MEGMFLRPLPLWKFQLSFILFLKFFGLTTPPVSSTPFNGEEWIYFLESVNSILNNHFQSFFMANENETCEHKSILNPYS